MTLCDACLWNDDDDAATEPLKFIHSLAAVLSGRGQYIYVVFPLQIKTWRISADGARPLALSRAGVISLRKQAAVSTLPDGNGLSLIRCKPGPAVLIIQLFFPPRPLES